MCRRLASIALAVLVALVFAASAGGAARIYVPNYGSSPSSVSAYERAADGSLSVLAGSPFAMVPGPPYAVSGPSGLAFAPEGAWAVSSYLFEGGVSPLAVGADGSVSPVGEPIVTASAVGLAVSPDGRFAYVSTREFGVFPEPATPAEGIHAYSIGTDGSLSEIGGSPFGGATEIGDLAMTPDGTHLFALRGDGTAIRRFSVGAGGSLGELGPATATPGGANQALVSPDGRFLFVAFTGAESGVVSYAIGGDGSLTQVGEPVPSSAVGLKYFDVAPSGRYIYLPDSGAEAILTIAVAADGRLSAIGSVPLAGVDAVGASPDGRFLYYAQAGGGGQIGVARIGDDGLPTVLGPVAPWDSGEPERIVFQPGEAPVAAFGPAGGVAGRATSFDASASQRAARYEWDFGDGTVLGDGGSAPAHVYGEPGDYRVRLTVADAQGCSTAPLYTGQSTRCPGGAQAQAVRQVEVRPQAPRLRALRVRPRRFAARGGRRKAARGRSALASKRARRAPRRTRLRYWLSRSATVRFVVQRRKLGRRVGGKCRRRTHANRKRRRCLLGYRRRGSPLYRHGRAGVNRSRFDGWVPFRSQVTGRLVRRIKLSPGVYRLRAIAIDSRGATSKRRSAWFRVARR